MKITYPGFNQLRFTLITLSELVLSKFVGIIFLLMGSFLYADFFKEAEITCQEKMPNKAIECVLNVNFFNLYTNSTYLGQLEGAEVLSSWAQSSHVYKVLLTTEKGGIDLTSVSSGCYSPKSQKAKAINHYIQFSSDPNFKVPSFSRWCDYPFLFLGTIFFLLGASSALDFQTNVILEINKNKNSLLIRKKNVFKNQETLIALPDIEQIIIQGKTSKLFALSRFISSDDKGGPKLTTNNFIYPSSLENKNTEFNAFIANDNSLQMKGLLYRLTLVLKNGDLIVLTGYFSPNFNELRKITNQINQFIKADLI